MEVLRLKISGFVTSFRHPHFIQGIQPSYHVPPPATLYGHICSALGRKVHPATFEIAYMFTYKKRWYDFEHTYLVTDTYTKLSPFQRELLFQPSLTLYINRPDWIDHFQYPRYTLTLGRSQDLVHYDDVALVELKISDQAYVTDTIIPLRQGLRLPFYRGVRLPRYSNTQRETAWDTYAHITQKQKLDGDWHVDPSMPSWRGLQPAVIWLAIG